MSKSELRSAAMKGEDAPRFDGAGNQLTIGSVTDAPDAAAPMVPNPSFTGQSTYPHPSFQEVARRRGELLKEARGYVKLSGGRDNPFAAEFLARIDEELKEG